jgi:pimeloyl-ACP methyl ester carboxylesterase
MVCVRVNKKKSSRRGAAKVVVFLLCLILFLICSTSTPQVIVCLGLVMSSSPAAGSIIRIIQGRRCLLLTPPPPPPPSSSSPTAGTIKEPSLPPLIILGGMAQTIASWQPHLPALSSMNKNRHILVYECLGQGKRPLPLNNNNNNEHDDDYYYSNVTLPRQAEMLMSVLNEVFPSDAVSAPTASGEHEQQQQQQFDLVGFSFGGRVAMAMACLYPNRIHKLHLTGVALERSDYAHLQIASWKDLLLQHDDNDNNRNSNTYLRSFAWSVLLATYSPSFLRRQQQQEQPIPSSSPLSSSSSSKTSTTRLEQWIHHIRSANDRDGLLALLQQAEIDNVEHPWHVASMADRLAAVNANTSTTTTTTTTTAKIMGHVCVGALDSMAPPDEAAKLCHRLGWNAPTSIPGCGHAVALEAPRQWRSNVLDFLSSEE